jgi:ankyrin repeat protein
MSSADAKLCEASMYGDVPEIERQLAAGANPNAFDGTPTRTPLREAARNGHTAAIAVLLKAGARVNGADGDGYTPLMYAARNGCATAVHTLVAAGADIHRADKDGDTALHWASMNGRFNAARVLVVVGAWADVTNKWGKRPVDKVRAPRPSLIAALRLRHATAPPRRRAQICALTRNKSEGAALRTLLTSVATWSRRRPVAIACYGVRWE